MDTVSGFDAKEYHGGIATDFFAPIGLGVSVTNYEKFKTEYVRVWRDAFADAGLEQNRLIHGARDLEQLYPSNKLSLQEKFVEGIRSILIETNFFFTIIKENKIIRSSGWYKKLPAHDFMRKSLRSYSYWCAWKQLQQWRKTENRFIPCIDEFDGEETLAWNYLSRAKPRIFYRGDMSNPLISTSDVILDLLDYKLRKQRLCDVNVEQELRNLGLSGTKQFIGQPDFHSITPISSNMIDKRSCRAKPVFYILFEDRPTALNKEEWVESKIYSGMTDFAIMNAFEKNGCFKFYDPSSDYKFLSSNDYFIWCGPKGKEIVEATGKASGVKDIYYNGQKGIL